MLECGGDEERCRKVLREVWEARWGVGRSEGRCGKVCWSVGEI